LLRPTLNLGILAHVDAGKTTLTERLLYAAGVIDAPGSVDAGTTQTDTLALERQRGITIKSAVVSFEIDGVTVNLIDTPGHPDFVAEVERVLSVLDGAVLVVSAVEGVQPQTRLLMRALQRLRVPTLLFVNKIDRRGARETEVVDELRRRLTPDVAPLGAVRALGTRNASFSRAGADDAAATALVEALADHDGSLLAAYVEGDGALPDRRIGEELAAQAKRGVVYPVLFGSALTGAGVEELAAAIAELLPARIGDADAPLSAGVFKIERGATGEKVAYVRLFAGTIRTRDRVALGTDGAGKVTAIRVFEGGASIAVGSVSAGRIARIWGLADARIGDAVGAPPPYAPVRQFAPPTLETVVVPADPGDGARLRTALAQLAEQDPLIDVRQDDTRRELSVSLYGEVQKEVIQATLAGDFGVEVAFRETTPLYVERPLGAGEAAERLHAETNPYYATIGLRVERAPVDSGIEFRAPVDPRAAPLYLFKTFESFVARMEGYVREALREGLYGWRVTDCLVTMIECVYSVPDGPASKRGPLSTASDFRKLTPLVLAQALERAGTVVCEPMTRARVELPAGAIGSLLPALTRLAATPEPPGIRGELATVHAVMPAARVHELQRQLPGLSGGEGSLETSFAGYRPVAGEPPRRSA